MEKYSSYLANYIRPAIDSKYRTRSDAADDLGIDQAVLSRICSGKRFGISEHLVENICIRLELDPAEGLLRLFLSKNSKIKQHFLGLTRETSIETVHPDKYKPTGKAHKFVSEDYLPVPLVSAATLAEHKSYQKGKKTDFVLVPKDFLPLKGNLIAFEIKGDSMAPTLPDGSIVAVDLNDTLGTDNCILLFKQKNEVNVGRAFVQDSFLQLCSDNLNKNKFPNYICDMTKIESEKINPILGRVVWSLKKL